jgi:hypothetical protein
MDEPQILKTPAGDELVVLTRRDYDALVQELADAREDAEDIATYDRCKAELAASGVPNLPAEVTPLLFKTGNRVAAFRQWRGLSLPILAAKADIDESALADIETRMRSHTIAEAERLAAALDIPIGWIEP